MRKLFLVLGISFGVFFFSTAYGAGNDEPVTPPAAVSEGSKVPQGDGISKTFFDDGQVATLIRWKQGVKTVEATYYQNGFIKSQKQFDGDEVVDKQFYDNGNPSVVCLWIKGLKEGAERHFDEQGHVIEEWNYVHGLLDGLAKIYHAPEKITREDKYCRDKLWARLDFDDDGRIRSLEEWNKDGSRKTQYSAEGKKGWQRAFYSKDKARYEINYEGGLADGEAKTYFPDGRLSQRLTFKGGFKQGPEISYYQNGQVRSRVLWENSRREGKAQYLDSFGHLLRELNYSDDVLSGPATYFYPNGKIQELVSYEKGIKRTSRIFDMDGIIHGDFELYDDGSPRKISRK